MGEINTTRSIHTMDSVMFRIPPYQYLHVLDTNTNVTRNVTGPCTFTRQDHEKVVEGPTSMITIPPRHYVIIADPAVRDDSTGEVVLDEHGLVKLKHGDFEIRTHECSDAPFPLYPGESQHGAITQLRVVEKNQAIKLKATREFTDDGDVVRRAGDEWLFEGPGTYQPRIEADITKLIDAIVIGHSQALRLRARCETTDRHGEKRCAGEEWLVRETGAYMPSIDEDVVEMVQASILTERRALRICATKTFEDVYGVTRKAGEEWLVTSDMADAHLCDVYENILGEVKITTLSSRQYAVVVDPIIEGTQRLGMLQLRKGEMSFFLQPGESLRNGIEDVLVLSDDAALLLQAREAFEDTDIEDGEDGVTVTARRQPGDRWMVYGPREYIPPVEVEITAPSLYHHCTIT